MQPNSAEYLHRPDGNPEAGLRRPRHLVRRSAHGGCSGGEVCFRRSTQPLDARLVTGRASFDFGPGEIPDTTPLHPSVQEIASVKIDDKLMARDTTCVDAIDKDGVMFSATPSGAWLPSVIAGDTGIPLTQRAQSFLLVPGHPNELAGGKRPRVTLSPTLVTKDGKAFMTLVHPRRRQSGPVAASGAARCHRIRHECGAAIEAPRFQTRHLVSSFDNHAMNPGDLLHRRSHFRTGLNDLTERGHHTSSRTRWNSGANPVLIRVLPNGVLEAGADPWGYRIAQGW